MSIRVENLQKRFGAFEALNDVSLEINGGELVALLGPSGSGKTTLLRVIAGLEHVDAGRVLLEGEDASARHPRERGVGFVFQHYALFRHMTIFENVAFGLRVKPRRERPAEAGIRKRVMDLLGLVQLDWLADRYPHQLSGGQRQRIALARALAVEPRVLLLDEPFGALDAKVRKELRRWLRRLHDELHVSTIFVTHDQEEAMEVSDRIVVMNHGRIEQVGTPDEVYQNPATSFVYQFLGEVNLFHGRLPDGGKAFARPHEIEVLKDAAADTIPARVRHVAPLGPVVRVDLERQDGTSIEARLPREQQARLALVPGSSVYLRARSLRVFPAAA